MAEAEVIFCSLKKCAACLPDQKIAWQCRHV